jgi:pimeloyl-ACP methyl ester carboxylesterase
MTVLASSHPALEIHRRDPPEPRPDRHTLVFVHGAFAGAWCWEEYFTPYFSALGWPTVSFSLRGHGTSDGASLLDLASLSDYVDDLRRVLETLDGPAVLVGHSMGGMVVQKFMEREGAAEATAGAVLMASVGPWGLLESTWHMTIARPALLQGLSTLQFMGKSFINLDVFYESLFSTEIPPERAERFARHFQRESQRVILDMTLWDVPRLPPRHAVPTLVMGAAEDVFIPKSMVTRTARYFDAEPLIVPGMAHAMMLEQTWRRAAEPIAYWLRAHDL